MSKVNLWYSNVLAETTIHKITRTNTNCTSCLFAEFVDRFPLLPLYSRYVKICVIGG
jgi:hypothetical protein